MKRRVRKMTRKILELKTPLTEKNAVPDMALTLLELGRNAADSQHFAIASHTAYRKLTTEVQGLRLGALKLLRMEAYMAADAFEALAEACNRLVQEHENGEGV
jgi:hypothetical protein